jgi:predicted nucleic acid-binding protein
LLRIYWQSRTFRGEPSVYRDRYASHSVAAARSSNQILRTVRETERRVATTAFELDWQRTFVVALDDVVCRRAAELGIVTGARSLDALHLAAAERTGGRSVPIVTFDIRLGQAGRSLGFVVIGS